MKNIKGLTLFETMLVVSISMAVMVVATMWLSVYQKQKYASGVATDVVQIVSAIDKRIFLDGYDSTKWGDLEYSNNSEVRNFFNEKLISKTAGCGKSNGWEPITDKVENVTEASKMENAALLPCNLWSEKTPWGSDLSVQINDDNGKISSVDLFFKMKDNESFEENFSYMRKALSEMKAKDNQEISGVHYYTFVNESDKNTPITPLKCLDLKSSCLLKATFSAEEGGSEHLLVSGKNSMINSAITFKPDSANQAVSCLRWKYDGSGNYVSSTVKCGFGIYDTADTETNKRVDLVMDSVTTKGFYLNKSCNRYNYNFTSQTLQVEGTSPCGIYEQDGSVIQVVDKMYADNLFARQIQAKDLFISNLDVKEALTVMDTLTAKGNVKVDGNTKINQGLTVEKDAKFLKNLEIGDTLNVKEDTTLNAVAAENIYSATDITANTFKGDFLDLNLSKGINDICNASEAGKITATTQATNTDYKNILLVCKATTKAPSDFRWRSIGGIEGQIMAFTTQCPPGWKKFSQADGRFLIGAGRYVEGATIYNYNVGDTGGEAMHVLNINEMPNHQHETHVPTGFCTKNCVTAGVETNHTDMVWSSNSNIKTSSTGGNKAHENRPPYVAVNWCIFET